MPRGTRTPNAPSSRSGTLRRAQVPATAGIPGQARSREPRFGAEQAGMQRPVLQMPCRPPASSSPSPFRPFAGSLTRRGIWRLAASPREVPAPAGPACLGGGVRPVHGNSRFGRCLPLCRGRSWHAAVPRRREGKREGRSCAVSTLERFGRRAGGCRPCLPEFVLAGQGDGLLDSSSQGIQEPSQQEDAGCRGGWVYSSLARKWIED